MLEYRIASPTWQAKKKKKQEELFYCESKAALDGPTSAYHLLPSTSETLISDYGANGENIDSGC